MSESQVRERDLQLELEAAQERFKSAQDEHGQAAQVAAEGHSRADRLLQECSELRDQAADVEVHKREATKWRRDIIQEQERHAELYQQLQLAGKERHEARRAEAAKAREVERLRAQLEALQNQPSRATGSRFSATIGTGSSERRPSPPAASGSSFFSIPVDEQPRTSSYFPSLREPSKPSKEPPYSTESSATLRTTTTGADTGIERRTPSREPAATTPEAAAEEVRAPSPEPAPAESPPESPPADDDTAVNEASPEDADTSAAAEAEAPAEPAATIEEAAPETVEVEQPPAASAPAPEPSGIKQKFKFWGKR